MTCFALLLRFALTLAAWHGDVDLSAEARAALYQPVIEAICKTTTDRVEQLFLVRQAWEETKFASHVLLGHCERMPKGERCDNLRAWGPWQNHRPWCQGAWDTDASLVDRYSAGARCSLRLFRFGVSRCGNIEGGFYAQRGAMGCQARWAAARARRMERTPW